MSDRANNNSNTRRPGPGPGHGPMRGLMGPAEKAKDFKGSIKRLIVYMKPHAGLLFVVLVMTIISLAFTLISPRITGKAMDLLFNGFLSKRAGGPGIDFTALGQMVLLLAGLFIVSAIFQWAQSITMASVAKKVIWKLRQQVDQKLGKLPLKYYDDHPRGDILSRMTNDVDNINSTLQQSLVQIFSSVVTVIGIFFMMLSISPILTLVCLLALPLSMGLAMFVAKSSQKYFVRQMSSTGALNGHVEEAFTGHTIVRAFNREKAMMETFDKQNNEMCEVSEKAQFLSGVIMPMTNIVNQLTFVAICVIGAARVIAGYLSFGDVQAVLNYSRSFTQPIGQMAGIMNTLQSTVASAERVFELLDETEEKPDMAKTVIEKAKGQVTFENVSFRYQNDIPLIENMNLTVQSGQKVAIVGPTGAGKTTLVNLLMRFYELRAGRILLDGIDICDLSRDNLRNNFGMVLQDAWLFNGTIRENLAYGNLEADFEELKQASRDASVHRFVRTLTDGYETQITDDAGNISQGQRQLLTIARAFVSDPNVLILDEATSSVDTRTEVLIQQAMAKLMQGRTSFIIAHRLSTIRDADIILVMDKGHIVEQGNHEELLAAGGFYYELYNAQFNNPLREAGT